LIGNDGIKANAARWRLVAAGDQTVDYIAQWFDANTSKAEQFRTPTNFPGFRILRVLQLINTPKADALREKLF
ncbi:MAG: hypothetical protein FWD31_10060, partial [Planctomycetaceae bacterium]|nr:hypothetical protein [Planctomycetaceae bacterium]